MILEEPFLLRIFCKNSSDIIVNIRRKVKKMQNHPTFASGKRPVFWGSELSFHSPIPPMWGNYLLSFKAV